MTEEKICPFIMGAGFPRGLNMCIKEKCMAWEEEITDYGLVVRKGYCKLIDK